MEKEVIKRDANDYMQAILNDPYERASATRDLIFRAYVAGREVSEKENAQLKEELKHEELKMEAIQGHVDALWEENAQLKGKVSEWDLTLALMEDYMHGEDGKAITNLRYQIAEYLKTITDKTENL